MLDRCTTTEVIVTLKSHSCIKGLYGPPKSAQETLFHFWRFGLTEWSFSKGQKILTKISYVAPRFTNITNITATTGPFTYFFHDSDLASHFHPLSS